MFLNQGLGVVGTDLGDLGKPGDLGSWVADEAVDVTAPLLARSDDCDVDSTVRGRVSLGCPASQSGIFTRQFNSPSK